MSSSPISAPFIFSQRCFSVHTFCDKLTSVFDQAASSWTRTSLEFVVMAEIASALLHFCTQIRAHLAQHF